MIASRAKEATEGFLNISGVINSYNTIPNPKIKRRVRYDANLLHSSQGEVP